MEVVQALEAELNNAIGNVETVETVDEREEDTVTYTVMETLSQRGKPKLLDSRGYSYTVRYKKPHAIYWRCALRNNKVACGASVIQKGEDFRPGPFAHNHESKPNSNSLARMIADIKWKTMSDTSRSATAVVREVYRETFGDDVSSLVPGVPKQENLARRVNRWKQRMSEESTLCADYIPGDSNITPSMVFQYRMADDSHSRKKGHNKHNKRKKRKSNKNKEKRTAENSRDLLEHVTSSLPQRQRSATTMSDVSKAASLKEIGALIAERDAALRRVQEIEQILFTKYQIPVVDSF